MNFKNSRCVRLSYIVLGAVSIIVGLLAWRVIYLKNERRKLIFSDLLEENQTINDDVYADTSFQDYRLQVNNILKLREKVKIVNDEQKVYNEYLYGPIHNTVIVIHVKLKVYHLKQLLASLKQVAGIMRTLLIFAHDYYDNDINSLIQRIDFAKYIQIFYPYSSQLHPHIYPGNDPKFCSNDVYHCKESQNMRDATLAQKKLSWWWKMNHIFDHLEVTKYYNGYVTFLEEDQYVSEDFIYMIKLLGKVMPDYCPQCDMIIVGSHLPMLSAYHIEQGPIMFEEFGTTEYNMGLVFNRTVWGTIKSLRDHFCYYNDYDWVDSVRYLGTKRPQGRFLMLSSKGPRVFHIGNCNLPYTGIECSVQERLQEILLFLKLVRRGLYPRSIPMNETNHAAGHSTVLKELGNWKDARDRELCMFFASKTRFRFKL